MKRTALLFLAAVGLLTVAVAVPRRVEPPQQTQALDGEGIDALRVEGEVVVVIDYTPDCDCRDDADAPPPTPPTPQVGWPSDGDGRVQVRRDGNTLVLKAAGFDGARITLTPPPGVRRIEVPGGSLQSEDPLPAMSIRTRDSFTWSADTPALDIVQVPSRDCLADDYCRVSLEVAGTIGDVRVEAGRAGVALQKPQRFDRATVRLAPESSLSVEDGRRVDHIVLEHVDFAGEPVSAAVAVRLREALRAARDQGPDDADASAATARGAVRAAARDDAP